MSKEAVKVKGPGMNKDTKIILGIVGAMVLICAALIVYYFYGVNSQIIATYKDGKITRGEFTTYYKLYQPMLSYYGYDDEAIKGEVVNKIILDKLIVEKADKEKVKLTAEKEEEVKKLYSDKDEMKYFEGLGIDKEKMKEIYYNDALVNAYIEKMTGEATEEKIRSFIAKNEGDKANYNMYITNYILYPLVKDSNEDEVKQKAEATLARIKNGEDIATVGGEVSADGSTQFGADFECSLNGTTVKEFEDAVRSMTVGQLHDGLVKSEKYGYFIIQLKEVKENARVNGEKAADNYVNEVLAKMKKDSDVKLKDAKIDKVIASIPVAKTDSK